MLNEQLQRDGINRTMSENGDYSERMQELLYSAGIEVFLSNLVGHSLAIHEPSKAKRFNSTTTYTDILGYQINPDFELLRLFVRTELSHTSVSVLEFNFTARCWHGKGDVPVTIKQKNVSFTNRILKPHRELFKAFGLQDQKPLGRNFSLFETSNRTEIVASISSIAVLKDGNGKLGIKLTPLHCLPDMNQVRYLEIWEGENLWSILPGRKLGRIFFL